MIEDQFVWEVMKIHIDRGSVGMGGNEDNTMIEDQSVCEVMKVTQ